MLRNAGAAPAVVAQLFSEAGVYDYVTELYDPLHLSSTERALDDIETYLHCKVVFALALKDDLILYHGSYASIECLTFRGAGPMDLTKRSPRAPHAPSG
ncbi:MAG: DUF3791 domain-containing protein [Eggerthella lenta]